MATRLEAALGELAKALRGRPYVLVFQQNHDDAPVHHIGTVRPAAQPLFVSRGLCLEAHDFLVAEAGDRSEVSSRHHKNKPARDNARTLDLIGLVIWFGDPSPEYMAELERIVGTWTDEQVEEAEKWAGAEHLGASDNPGVKRLPRPTFFPEDWR